ncbi:unnamed protein product [Trichogramma brassicae]|uniref:Potassium channel voltage dependent Kv4 C-terminal domain-containing protein n=1 Tax=Trichogramma brassicae TaxID=86971 RepID=A0A6H5IXG2_9HYME|nr:unnamed protein product [Trichogramma brassicae]
MSSPALNCSLIIRRDPYREIILSSSCPLWFQRYPRCSRRPRFPRTTTRNRGAFIDTYILTNQWLLSGYSSWDGWKKLRKARLARIRIAKASSGAAFVSKKKAAEARLAAQESGLELDDSFKQEDIFELQHHHLLRCLEKTTVSCDERISSYHLLATPSRGSFR